MFVVRVHATLRAADRDRALEQLDREASEVPQRFPGCRWFRAFVDPVEPSQFLLYEEWDTRESFEAYRRSDYFAEAGRVLFPAMEGAPDSAYFTAALVGP